VDDQQKLQQKMMTYMMIFFGFMFFSVPSGLCIYFIASSLWGIAERKLLPKISHETQQSAAPAVADARKAPPDKGKPRGSEPPAASGAAPPEGVVRRTTSRLGDTALGKLFKSLSEAADNQPRTEAGKRRTKKRGKGGK
jgi:membrane protein insertase Oxa1/YidC/SpoIIIJ